MLQPNPIRNSFRFPLLNWLLAVVLGLSLGLNAYLLLPRYAAPGGRWLVSMADTIWDADDDDDDEEEGDYSLSRVALADELRRTRLQLTRCRDGNPATDELPGSAGSPNAHTTTPSAP